MKGAKDFLKTNEIMPRISFKDEPVHTVKLINSKEDSMNDGSGGTVTGLKVLVEENGEKKTFFTSSASLITKLAELEEGETVTIELKSVKNPKGGFKSVFEITKGSVGKKKADKIENQETGEEAPPIQLNEEEEIDVEDIPF